MPYYPKQQMITQSGVPRLARPLIAVLCLFLLYYLFSNRNSQDSAELVVPQSKIDQMFIQQQHGESKQDTTHNPNIFPVDDDFLKKMDIKVKSAQITLRIHNRNIYHFQKEIQLPLYETSSQVSNIPKRSS